MWRRSFQRAMGLEEQNLFGEVSRQLDFLSAIDPASIHIALDPGFSAVLGFMVLSDGELDHLYVRVGYQGMGLGTALLNLAKLQSPAGIELFSFQRNRAAHSFYERRGFKEVGRGFASWERGEKRPRGASKLLTGTPGPPTGKTWRISSSGGDCLICADDGGFLFLSAGAGERGGAFEFWRVWDRVVRCG